MKTNERRRNVEDVLNEYMASSSEPSYEILLKWIHQFPQYEQELTEFTISWILMDKLALSSEAKEPEEDELISQGMEVIQDLLYRGREHDHVVEETPLRSLVGEAQRLGMLKSDLAKQTDLSTQLLTRLDRRFIRYASIPKEVTERIARVIQRSRESVVQYLQNAPRLGYGVDYRSKQAPSIGDQQDFFDAVRSDTTLSEERRRYWLALEPDDT